jgi:hypothetical protein
VLERKALGFKLQMALSSPAFQPVPVLWFKEDDVAMKAVRPLVEPAMARCHAEPGGMTGPTQARVDGCQFSKDPGCTSRT